MKTEKIEGLDGDLITEYTFKPDEIPSSLLKKNGSKKKKEINEAIYNDKSGKSAKASADLEPQMAPNGSEVKKAKGTSEPRKHTSKSDKLVKKEKEKKKKKNGSNGSITSSTPKRVSGFQYWSVVFQWETQDEVKEFDKICKSIKTLKFLYKKEIGQENGQKHLQCFLSFKAKFRPSESKKFNTYKYIVLRTIGETEIILANNLQEGEKAKIRWVKCDGGEESNIDYISKKITADPEDPKIYGNYILPEPLIDPLEKFILKNKLYFYQKFIIDIIPTNRDNRDFWWFYDQKGRKGKSDLVKHLVMNYPNTLIVSGTGTDVKFQIKEYCDVNDHVKTLIWDLPRSTDSKLISYQALEEAKQMVFASSKYKGGMVVKNKPHIIIFANTPPDYSKLSSDKWKVFEISKIGTISTIPKYHEYAKNSFEDL